MQNIISQIKKNLTGSIEKFSLWQMSDIDSIFLMYRPVQLDDFNLWFLVGQFYQFSLRSDSLIGQFCDDWFIINLEPNVFFRRFKTFFWTDSIALFDSPRLIGASFSL
jgi:hypothetical protein